MAGFEMRVVLHWVVSPPAVGLVGCAAGNPNVMVLGWTGAVVMAGLKKY